MAETRPEVTLAWEARQRPWGAVAAAVAALSLIGAWLLRALAIGTPERAWFAESLGRVVEAGPRSAELPSLRTPIFQVYVDNATMLLLGALVAALGAIAGGWALYVLARATRARREEMAKPFVYLPLLAGVMSAIAAVAGYVALDQVARDFLAGPRTVQAAQDIEVTPTLLTAQYVGLFGQNLLLPLAFVFISFNAMRAGLLTRFLGVLGIIAGVLILLPIPTPIPPVQIFWLLALAFLLSGRFPGGVPPAWRTGKAEPWPSPAEMQAARERGVAAGGTDRGPARPEPAAVAAGRPASSSRKKKRKRRA